MINILGNIIVFGFVAFLIGKVVWQESESFAPWKGWIKELLRQCWKKRLRIIYLIFAVVIGLSLLYVFGLVSLEIINIDWKKVKSGESGIRNLGIAFLGTVSGFGALFGVYLAILRSEENKRQNDTAEQGLITDRINKAVEGLGKNKENDKPVIEVRIGALLALERIAQDSIRDHISVMEILCAYIQENSPITGEEPEIDKIDLNKKPRKDIGTALNIIGRRHKWVGGKKYLKKEKQQNYRIDLRNCYLYGAGLDDANLNNAQFDNANLTRANLTKANLTNATLGYAILNGAYLDHANMCGVWLVNAELMNAYMIRTNISNANLGFANFYNAKMDRCYAYRVDISDCKNLIQRQLDRIFCVKEFYMLPEGLTRPEHWPTDDLSYDDFIIAYKEWCQPYNSA